MSQTEDALPLDRYRVLPDAAVDLERIDPADTGPYLDKKQARRELAALVEKLDRLQRLLWADAGHKLLVVLQAMDTGGKDGTIRRVFGRLNPQGVTVTGFKVPTPEELAHDYLWRVHKHAPAAGSIAVFNRSHYEDVLIVRVLGLVDHERWSRRYAHINDLERLLADEGTTILKFFLNISKDEQRRRLQARLDHPEKRWKFSEGDLEHRGRWADYMQAYGDAIQATSTVHAPWYVVPADTKWYRDVVVAAAVGRALEGLGLAYPEADAGLEGIVID